MATLYGGINDDTVLIESDTTDGSTVFIDASGNGNTVATNSGAPEHSTDRSVFGASSILFSSASDSLSIEMNTTKSYLVNYDSVTPERHLIIDFRLYLPELPSSTINLLEAADYETSCFLSLNSSGQLKLKWFFPDSIDTDPYITKSISAGEWYHIYIHMMGETEEMYWEPVSEIYKQRTTARIGLAVDGAITSNSDPVFTYNGGVPEYTVPFYCPKDFIIGNTYCYIDEIRMLIYDQARISDNFTPLTTAYSSGSGSYYISGTVKEGEVNIARTVRAYSRSDGSLLGSSISDDTTGEFTISNLPDAEEVYALCLDDDDGTEYNALIIDRIIPVLES